jgi:aminopeptidase N
MKRINIYITQKQKEALEALNELSLSEHIRRAIDEYLARLAKERKRV